MLNFETIKEQGKTSDYLAHEEKRLSDLAGARVVHFDNEAGIASLGYLRARYSIDPTENMACASYDGAEIGFSTRLSRFTDQEHALIALQEWCATTLHLERSRQIEIAKLNIYGLMHA